MSSAKKQSDLVGYGPEPFSASYMKELLAQFHQDGFLSIESFTTLEDVQFIKGLIEPLFESANDQVMDDLRVVSNPQQGDSGIYDLMGLANREPRLKSSLFYQRALAFTSSFYGRKAAYGFDHAIDKPPISRRMTEWHQDCAYSSRITLSARKLHWWLPLQSVDENNGCMLYSAGSHSEALKWHKSIEDGSALKAASPKDNTVRSCPLPEGGVTVHLPKTLHAAGPNLTNRRRLSWIVHLGVRGWIPRRL